MFVADHSPASTNREWEAITPNVDKNNVMFVLEEAQGKVVKVHINEEFFKTPRAVACGQQMEHLLAKLDSADPEQQRLISLIQPYRDPKVNYADDYLRREAPDSFSNYYRTVINMKKAFDTEPILAKKFRSFEDYLTKQLTPFSQLDREIEENDSHKLEQLEKQLEGAGIPKTVINLKLHPSPVQEPMNTFKDKIKKLISDATDNDPDLTFHL